MEGKDSALQQGIEKFQVQHLYIKWFDIAWIDHKNMGAPIAVLKASSNIKPLFNKPFSPVIFINNSLFQKIDSSGCVLLASQIQTAIQKKAQQINHTLALQQSNLYDNISEIQIDCDWTKPTKNKYFYFLECLKRLISNKQLSVTLRLFPYKYQSEMGIPPVDKAVLMCYNMEPIKNVNTINSIFNIDIFSDKYCCGIA